MSIEELVKELNEIDDHLTTRAADKLEELAAENERVKRARVEANNEWRKAYNKLTVKTEVALDEKDKEIASALAAVRDEVREECAKIAEQWECSNCNGHFHPDDNCSCDRPSWNGPLGSDQIAATIRARKETGE